MSTDLEVGLYIFILAGFLGYHLITRVPPLLHTPLMSATNALSGISLVGSLLVVGADYDPLSTFLGVVAVACSSTNVVSGFLITDRMLRMFRTEKEAAIQFAWLRLGRRTVLILIPILLCLLALLYWSERSGDSAGGVVLRCLYLFSAVLFILGLKGLCSPRHARAGMFLAEFGMAAAVAGTLFHPDMTARGYLWIAVGLGIGFVSGGMIGLRIPMTAVPQRTALSHSLGALAATVIGISEYVRLYPSISHTLMTPLGFEVLIGGVTVTGSLLAAAKLQGLLPEAPTTYRGQRLSNFILLAIAASAFLFLICVPAARPLFGLMVVLAFAFGCLLVIPIGAADMPTVIALLNSYGGLADAAMGFVLMNKVQIITGSLDGTSGFVLALLMCRAMNRSPWNVLFGAFGKIDKNAPAATARGPVHSITPEELATLLEDARSVIIAPGYGMAAAQAQHALSDLGRLLFKRGIDVKYAIHPVAGRMPGHMNVLLAEADIPYEQLYELERINPYFAEADVALVIGANDVVNPAARHDSRSPLYGMPILEVDRARSVVVLKRSLNPGFAGVDNELYYNPKCLMLFGDARESLDKLLAALKS
jgi:H+-translocating NAD(P) transhydrogenase subunit beta